jgi:hypothetical protein
MPGTFPNQPEKPAPVKGAGCVQSPFTAAPGEPAASADTRGVLPEPTGRPGDATLAENVIDQMRNPPRPHTN